PGRGLALRVRRARGAACDPDPVAHARDGRGRRHVSAPEGAHQILVVAHETVVSPALVELIEERAKDTDVLVTVVAPVNQPRQGYVVYYDTRRAAARRRLDKPLDLLRKAGVRANGVVVESDPVSAVRDAIEQLQPDE